MNSPRPILFVTPQFGGGSTGPETYARYLWEEFGDDPEIEFHLVAPEFSGVHARWHPAGRGRGSLDLYRRCAQMTLQVARELGAPGRRVLIHSNNSNLHPALLNYAGPLWGQINDYENAELWPRAGETLRRAGLRRFAALWRRRRLERRFLTRQDLTLCNSDFTRETILAAYRPPHPARVITLHKAVDAEFFRRPAQLPPDPLNRPAAARQFVFVGSDFLRKGLDVLLRAAVLLPAELDWHLAVVGVTREQMERALPGLLPAAVAARVTFAGRVEREQLRAILWHSGIFVLPSYAEAFGVALLEALAAGLPVVASRVGGIPEIVRHADAGILVPAGDPATLALALAEVPLWPRGEVPAGARAILERFSTRVMTRRLRELYLAAA